MKTLLILTLAATFDAAGLALVSSAQTVPGAPTPDCGPVEGTVAVADDAPVTPEMAAVSDAAARAAALEAVPGATVTDVDLEEEDGFLVYEVDLLREAVEFDVIVDAGSGEVLCSEQD